MLFKNVCRKQTTPPNFPKLSKFENIVDNFTQFSFILKNLFPSLLFSFHFIPISMYYKTSQDTNWRFSPFFFLPPVSFSSFRPFFFFSRLMACTHPLCISDPQNRFRQHRIGISVWGLHPSDASLWCYTFDKGIFSVEEIIGYRPCYHSNGRRLIDISPTNAFDIHLWKKKRYRE